MKGDEPAFPTVHYSASGAHSTVEGLTIRQWYAGMALQGLQNNPPLINGKKLPSEERSEALLAQCAYAVADAMIAEGEKHNA